MYQSLCCHVYFHHKEQKTIGWLSHLFPGLASFQKSRKGVERCTIVFVGGSLVGHIPDQPEMATVCVSSTSCNFSLLDGGMANDGGGDAHES